MVLLVSRRLFDTVFCIILLQAVPVANSIDYKNIEDCPQQQFRRYLYYSLLYFLLIEFFMPTAKYNHD